MVMFLLLTCLSFALMGFIIGIWARNFEQLQLVPLLVVTPLVFLGGSFYSISMLPPVWQTITLFNPVVYLISGFRWAFFDTSDVPVGSACWRLADSLPVLGVIWWISGPAGGAQLTAARLGGGRDVKSPLRVFLRRRRLVCSGWHSTSDVMNLRFPFIKNPPLVSVVRLAGMIGTGGRSTLNDAALAPLLERRFAGASRPPSRSRSTRPADRQCNPR